MYIYSSTINRLYTRFVSIKTIIRSKLAGKLTLRRSIATLNFFLSVTLILTVKYYAITMYFLTFKLHITALI